MDEARRMALRATLEDLLEDRARLDSAISVIQDKLGLNLDTMVLDGSSPVDALDRGPMPREVGPVAVGEGEFYGLSQTKAARAFLERAGRTRPQKTEDVLAALRKGGVHVGGKDPNGLLYRLMLRDKSFRRVGTSLWGLDSWYPSAPKKANPNQASSEDLPDPEDASGGSASEEPIDTP